MSDFREVFHEYQQRTWAGPVEQQESTTVGLLELEAWFEDDLPCEGVNHPAGTHGHAATSPAEFRIVAPCCGLAVNQCGPRVVAVLQTQLVRCVPEQGGCGQVLATSDLRVIPV